MMVVNIIKIDEQTKKNIRISFGLHLFFYLDSGFRSFT